ncbi:hypothetical protein NM688_g6834 [Phlebia brevispora]|uniref:Uncharacterized protein n=1 Tax=Phlebia brevispora TaxID=194682 RepID=A0ACC1SC07_9APHY|nr:hypothetical protein NM688_g6834 [Phlebia brevispora]
MSAICEHVAVYSFAFTAMSPYKGKVKNIRVHVPRHNSQRIGPLLTTQVEDLARKQKKRVDVRQTAYDPSSILAQAVDSASEWNSLLMTARAERGPQWDIGTQQFMVDEGSDLFYDPTPLREYEKEQKSSPEESADRSERASMPPPSALESPQLRRSINPIPHTPQQSHSAPFSPRHPSQFSQQGMPVAFSGMPVTPNQFFGNGDPGMRMGGMGSMGGMGIHMEGMGGMGGMPGMGMGMGMGSPDVRRMARRGPMGMEDGLTLDFLDYLSLSPIPLHLHPDALPSLDNVGNKQIGPSLPRSLLEELEGSERAPVEKLSRKDARKQERNEKKQRKANFFAHTTTAGKRHAEEEHIDSPTRKKVKLSSEAQRSPPSVKVAKNIAAAPSVAHREKTSVKGHEKHVSKPSEASSSKPKRRTALQKLAERTGVPSSHSAVLPKGRTQVETEEDAYIAYLEKKLGWSKGGKRTKQYGNGLDEDGLDDLLQDLDALEGSLFTGGQAVLQDTSSKSRRSEEEGEITEDDEDEDGEDGEDEEERVELDDGEDEDEDEGLSDSLSDEGVELSDDEDQMDKNDEDATSDDEDSVVSPADGEEEWTGFSDNAPDEDAPVTEETAEKPIPSIRYVPPHLRHHEAENGPASEEQLKLTRQLKGLLNRMSEQNIATIVDSIEEIYRKHRRHDVTSTLTTLIVDGICAHSLLLDSYVVLHAAFVSSLHKLVGVEFAAYFVQNVVTSYERYFAALQEPVSSDATEEDNRGKECSNLIVLLSELYNFQVISCVLVYDMIRGLLDGDLTELKVELLLKIVRNSGQQLRTDDPLALKDIVQMVVSKVPAQQNAMSSRTRFMVETLTNLKNNKVKKDAGAAAGNSAVDRMKKFLSGLGKKRHVRAHEPLRVTLDDLHSAESKGKWWLVGAAWSGDPLVEHQEDAQESQKKTENTENVLLKLARMQGMNTDIRRSVFVVLMSSEDYVDACERLSQLKLTEIQQREIIRVILHCCGNEKSYNPYYAFVGQQLCRTSHSYKVTLQFSLWDFLRDLGETNVGGAEVLKHLNEDSVGFDLDKISNARLRNVGRAYAWWLAKDACTLAILKPVDFTVLKPQTHTFFLELFAHLLIDTQLSTPLLSSDPKSYPTTRNRGPLEEVFIKATRVQALALGLIYFLGEYFRKTKEDEGTDFLNWAAKVAIDTLRTGVDVVAGL